MLKGYLKIYPPPPILEFVGARKGTLNLTLPPLY